MATDGGFTMVFCPIEMEWFQVREVPLSVSLSSGFLAFYFYE